MSDLDRVTDEQMARLQPYLPKGHGKPRVDDRRVPSGIWKRSSEAGVFIRMREVLSALRPNGAPS